ncbi:F-box/LRR-repeat protein At4g14103-like [Bidens hawaiensis]|uniref:F-box/LRR-repeat protein At4g14103-like n=1 Tax=Bidens hawaiensis TaxID=980011 RepID=UPI00404B9DF2
MSSISDDVDDRLSTLHDDIRSCILSLMPTKFAVQTSILSKRWRYSWTLVTNFDFDDNMHENPSGLDRLVDQALMHCKSSQVKTFRLHFSNKCWVLKSSASSLIDKAVLLNVHELDIHVVKLEVPLSMFTCKTLTNLRINCSVHDKNIWLWPSSVYLPCLKTLDVVVYKNPFCNAFKLISGCPMLESLSLEVTERNDEENYIFNIPTLKRLKVTFSSVITKVINKVVLQVPNLEYLLIGGVLCSFYVMEDVVSLIEVHVSFCKIPYDHLWVELLKRIHGVKSLLTHNVTSLVDMKNPFTSRLPLFPNMKQLKLKGLWHSQLVLRHLRRTPWLKHLCIEKVYIYFSYF